MQARWIALFALLCIVIPSVGPLVSNASGEDKIYEPGFVEWNVNNNHRIFISGDGENANLTRDYQGSSIGSVLISSGRSASIGPLTMPPLEMGFNGTFNVSTFVAAYVVSGSNLNFPSCQTQFPS